MDKAEAKKKMEYHERRKKYYKEKLDKLEAEEKRIGFKYSKRK
ncbi:hypothetical protein Oweho_3230 [Owenweeksia hongkongensis DSM 17368]|uniref:Uncharacterized protein n=1 Tax=Owenweeksia hongkongensis (strain DSM 17368 / CIP 108786 / JCM 12287 / NRRL B-23963 / UST20020801) TaxID=926562 RepID=G8R3U4_OWEHD|nr:hypothetical protein [Owenweeksia hongkongensis]AEV34181.1 hypothetical protein Oweho_3230 [Owenweeksia hongkongensis DSM 17368]